MGDGIFHNTQGGVTLSSFSGILDASRINNLPSVGTSDWATLATKPAWVASTQGGVTLSSFSGNLDASRINNLTTGSAATTWSTIDRPEWTNQFSWSNVGPPIYPSETTNVNVITNNSITPVSLQVYNIGQRFRRYNAVHTENPNLTPAIFDNGVRQTYFSGSCNELHDLPTIPTAGCSIPSWVKDTHNLVALSGFNKDLGWFDLLNRTSWVSSTQSPISLSGFNKDLAWTDVQTKLSLITTSQSSIILSGFNRDLTWSQLLSKP
jgi:hypothetical protein